MIKNIFLIGFAFILLESCSKSDLNQQPNVLIIVADDLGYGDISCFGQSDLNTPNIDKLAEEGVMCTDFYVPTPYCAPSRATILTGRFPLRHGLVKNPTPDAGINDIGLSADEITLGEVFQQAGYKTKMIGKWHLGHKEEFFPVNHGFDEYYGILYSNDMRPVQIIENKDTVEYHIDQNLLTQKYTQKAISFITDNKDKPFFLQLNHAMPHKPLAVSDRFYTPETPDNLYEDVMNELDWSVGEVIDKLKELNILENTIVIFMSDNGPWYGGSSGELRGMKATAWEGGIRVPFMLRYPKKFPQNTKVQTPCWSADIYPTLIALTGTKPQFYNIIDGEDITEVLIGNTTGHKAVFGMQNSHIMSVRKGDWKLFIKPPRQYMEVDLGTWVDPRAPDGETIIARFEQATPDQYPGKIPHGELAKLQLYNMLNDKSEANNVADQYPEIVEDLLYEYKQFEKSIRHLDKNI